MLKRLSAFNPALANDIGMLKLPWYHIKNVAEDADDAQAEVFIYDEIGGSFGVDANEFIQDLNAITAEKITLRINSPGGNVVDAIAIYNALVQHPANVLCRVDSMAASAASIVAMGGDTVEMMVGSQIMIHDAMSQELGNAKELRELAKWLDMQSDNIASIYAEKGTKTADEWRALMLAETWMFAEEAVEMGLASSVYTRQQVKQAAEEAGMPMEEEPSEEMMPDEEMEVELSDEEAEAQAVALLMNKRHVLSNRGYKFTGREKAPNPCAKRNGSAPRNSSNGDAELDKFIAGMQSVLGRK
ncbi:MAG TPA: head maturation protease, ClpP-related [Pyrinomonadaceae bacterium]|nr:head maturation protease, ClpP-related [Pyrinomonadaceae bacterium]